MNTKPTKTRLHSFPQLTRLQLTSILVLFSGVLLAILFTADSSRAFAGGGSASRSPVRTSRYERGNLTSPASAYNSRYVRQSSGNTGSGNTGSGNTGSGNTGSGNTGGGNTGSGNTGSSNTGSSNTGGGTSGGGTSGGGGSNTATAIRR